MKVTIPTEVSYNSTTSQTQTLYHLCLSRNRGDDFSIGERERNLRVKQDLYDYTK